LSVTHQITLSFYSGASCTHDIQLSYQVPVSKIHEFDPLLSDVRILQLHGKKPDHAHVLLEDIRAAGGCFLPALEQIIVERVCIRELNGLDEWIRQRDESGQPLKCVHFKDCEENVRPLVADFEQIMNTGSVVWESASSEP
jgi:hypothetical protein